ncbi:PAS domain S-box protein [Duganella sp. FT92W]|uniref:histidine kinase n=1 Tax=Pseudoduganella rivuli TaxID=2666085 RepID=A0A7X2LRD3_9BURK|nr:PAS domain S-box protein [Pseudoduganella rivuli]MRV72330.1 PAS domain S-box protein [Pseudoduganella rivuli]
MEQSDVANLAGVSLRDAGEFILHAIDEGFILLDHEFRIRCINDEALRLDGRPRSAILGLTYWDAWPGSENLPVAKAFRTALRDRSRTTVEQCCRHDGQELWQEARVFPFGEGLAVFYKNITERKLAEQAIRESETKFRNIADAIPQIVWSARPDGFADYFNRQWYNYTGLPENRGEGEAWLNLFHPDDQPALMARWQHSLATGAPYEVEFRIRHHSGQYRWTLGRALPVRNEQGEIVRWMGTSTDIHERVMAEEARRISESEFRTLAENIPQLAWMADRNGDIFWYNNRWFAYTGATLDEMKGWGWQKVHHPDHVERVVALYRKRIVEEQCMWEDTFPLRGADGQYRWFLSRAMPICDEDGHVLRADTGP